MQDTRYQKSKGLVIFEYVLLGLFLSVIALRSTFTEGPIAQSHTLPSNIGDILYSLTVSAGLFLSFILWFAWSICSKRFIYRFTGIEIGLCVFGIAAVAASLIASNKRLAINSVAVFFAPLLMAVLLVQILDSQSKIKLVLAVIAALGIVSTYQCLEQFFFSNQVTIEQYEQDPQSLLGPLGIEPGSFQQFLFEHRLYTQGVSGFFTTRNSAGSFALMASFAAIALFLDKFKNRDEGKPHVKRGAKYLAPPFRRGYSNLACGTAVAIVIFGLALTRSKGAILGSLFAAALFIAYLYLGHWLKTHKKAILIICLLLLIGCGGLVVTYGLKHNRLPGGSGMLVRWQYWHASAKMYADYPLAGVGPGNFLYFYQHYKPAEALESVADPHNFLLSVLTQYGPIGLVGFLAMIFLPLWKAIFSSSIKHRVSSIKQGYSLKTKYHQPSFGTLAIIFLIVISSALLIIRPLIISAAPADTLEGIIYVIFALYVTPVAVFFIGFLLLTAPLQTMRDTRYEIRDTRIVAVLFCAVLGVLLHNLIDFAIFEPGVLTTFWAIIACLIASKFQQNSKAHIVCKPASFVRVLILLAGVSTVCAYFNYAFIPVAKSTAKIKQAYRAFSMGQLPQAHHFFSAAAENDRLDPTALNLNGRLYLQHYSKTGEKQPAYPEARPSGRPALLKNAEQCFQQAIERNKADYKNYEKLSTVYDMLGQTQKAYDCCLRATELYPGSGRLRFKLAKIAEQLGKTDTAIEQYKKAIEIEDKYRRQFKIMYPERKEIVSRLGEEKYQFAKQRIKQLAEGLN